MTLPEEAETMQIYKGVFGLSLYSIDSKGVLPSLMNFTPARVADETFSTSH